MARTVLITLVCMFVSGMPAVAQPPRGNTDFHQIVPRDWKLLPGEGKWHERRFVSANRDAWLSLYVKPVRGGDSVQAQMNALLGPGDEVTYQRGGRGWGVLSGYKGNRIFYHKAMLACGNRKWHYLSFEYPAEQKRAFDRFVTRSSYALKAYERMGCDAV